MHTFLALAGSPVGARNAFAAFADRLRLAAPWAGDETIETLELPELRGGFVTICSPPDRDRFETWTDGSLSVLLDGELFGMKPGQQAAAVARCFQRGGAASVCALNGSFSAVFFEHAERRATIASDAIGARSLRYLDGATFAASPHDLSLACAAPLEGGLDWISAASSVACDWSIGGRSLLGDVRTAGPLEIVTWQAGRSVRSSAPSPASGSRIDAADRAGLRQTLESMVEAMGASIEDLAASGEEIEVELTAGLDTRALLAAAVRFADRSRIRCVTRGLAEAADARAAARIARRLGVRHELEAFGVADVARAVGDVDLLAFHLSGDTSAKRIGDASFATRAEPAVRLDGTGGEIFRAYYHPRAATAPGEDHDGVTRHLAQRFPRLASLPWLDAELPERVRDRIAARMGELSPFARAPRDALDLFYACERVGRWGSLRERHPARRRLRSPFRQPDLLRLQLRLPTGAGAANPLHRELLDRFAPAVRHQLVNARYILPGESEGALRRNARKVRQTIARRFTQSGGESLDRQQAELFRGPLAELLHDSVLASGSVTSRLFTRNGIEGMLSEHARRVRDHTEVLGLLLTLERWQALRGRIPPQRG